MSKLTLEYPNGDRFDFVHAYGLTNHYKLLDHIPNRDLKSHIENIRNLEIRDDDIYLATFPKCGEVEDWKNHFTVAQNEKKNEMLAEKLIDTELKFRYTLLHHSTPIVKCSKVQNDGEHF